MSINNQDSKKPKNSNDLAGGSKEDELWKQILREEGLSWDDIAEDSPSEAKDVPLETYMASTADEKDKVRRLRLIMAVIVFCFVCFFFLAQFYIG